LTAGVLILLNATVVAAAATWFPEAFPTMPGSSGNDISTLYTAATVGLMCGALVVLGAMMLRNRPEHRRIWGIMIVAFSLPSVVTGGGFIIGFILGAIGGASAFSQKHKTAD
jgi:hypothetical protein